MARIERATSPLPRECSATELPGRIGKRHSLMLKAAMSGEGEGNRTLVVSLEGFCSTIELHPPCFDSDSAFLGTPDAAKNWWRGKDSNLRRLSQQIYSLPPLTAREPLRTKPGIFLKFQTPVNETCM